MHLSVALCTLLLFLCVNISICHNIPHVESTLTHRPAHSDEKGTWKKRVEWKARWVKEYHEKKILVEVWKKVWGPVEINEWVPLPLQPPPAWRQRLIQ